MQGTFHLPEETALHILTLSAIAIGTSVTRVKEGSIMSEQKRFNLLRYVYGELYLSSRHHTVTTLTVETWKVYSWRKVLEWLSANNHISGLKIEYISPTRRRISCIFNHNNIIYPEYLNYLQRLEV